MSLSLKLASQKDLKHFTKSRVGETKIGDTIGLIQDPEDLDKELRSFGGKYCILGIPEDIGPYANLGKRGTSGAYEDFLSYFLNIQDNGFLSGSQLLLLGSVDLDKEMKNAEKLDNQKKKDLLKLRELVESIDNKVYPIIRSIIAAGKIPVVIGGGHNNAYPLLKGSFLGLNKTPMAAVNIDPHADLRVLEGRHSGNGFSYAIADGFLEKYHPVGLHENYNNEYTFEKLNSDKHLFKYITHEEIIFKEVGVNEIVGRVSKFIKNSPFGLEIDLDGIKFTESSARTPVGMSESKVRKLLHHFARLKNIVYLNLSEGIPSNHGQTGKLTAYLVADFIRANSI